MAETDKIMSMAPHYAQVCETFGQPKNKIEQSLKFYKEKVNIEEIKDINNLLMTGMEKGVSYTGICRTQVVQDNQQHWFFSLCCINSIQVPQSK